MNRASQGKDLRSKLGDGAFAVEAATAFFTRLLLPPLGLALYLWTVVLVAQLGMEVAAVVGSVFFPAVAALLLGWLSWRGAGLSDPYCLALLVYGGLWLASWLSIALLLRAEPLPMSSDVEAS
jgi:hypothetical protein